MFEALFDLNIIHKSKYFETFHVEHRLFVKVIEEYLREKKAEMTMLERIKYFRYKRGAVKMGSFYNGVPRAVDKDFSEDLSSKASQRWEVADVYYEVPKHEDVVKHMM
jgi:myo-inositol-1-phosphate synthase